MIQYSQENQMINREQKDRLFKIIFGRHENRAWTLSLYNAINGTSYDNPDDIEITTIENAVYMGMANDVSFIIENVMNLFEHQSSVNPNMPMRMLIHTGQLYSKYAEDRRNRINLYGNVRNKFPVPKLICFYNGLADAPDSSVMNLRDSFDDPDKTDIDVRVTMLNINHGHNKKLMESCRALNDYAEYVENWRVKYRETNDKEYAASQAIEMLPDDSPIKPFLISNKAEVAMSILTEYDEAWTMELFKDEGREEGRAEGRVEGRVEGREESIDIMLKAGLITEEQAREARKIISEQSRSKV